MSRPPAILHSTSRPLHFFGRQRELAVLDDALQGGAVSLMAMAGPGGQGKTAIAQHWLESVVLRQQTDAQQQTTPLVDGVFLWSFYRGKNSDLCLRQLLAYADNMSTPPEVSASFCVDQLVPRLRRERWAIVLDGTEVVQHEDGAWFGRFVHPELGRLLEELASEPMPGVVVVTTRFPLPTLEHRKHARLVSLSTLDADSAASLLHSLGVGGVADERRAVAAAAGLHAKAVELLGTYLAHFHGGDGDGCQDLQSPRQGGASDEEWYVSRILDAYQRRLPAELQDILALTLAFRQPPTETRLLQYLVSEPVQSLLHKTWGRRYDPFPRRGLDWLPAQVALLCELRLLERIDLSLAGTAEAAVLDAHPLVRRGFEEVLGPEGQQHTAQARAGFLRGRPDRRSPQSLEEAREEVELFHANCEAGLWAEADSTLVALDNPKHRFLAPAFERDLLLRFFPGGDWKQPPLWPGFGRWRSLAICFELLGQFNDALEAYRSEDAALRGDALLALGQLKPLANIVHVQQPWNNLWLAYRAHGLCLLGRGREASQLARSLIPIDVYEWVHVFECLLRLRELDVLDLGSLLYRPPGADEHRWSQLARRRMHLDYLRLVPDSKAQPVDVRAGLRDIVEQYDRGGLPLERTLSRLSLARHLMHGENSEAVSVANQALELSQRHHLAVYEIDARAILGELGEDHTSQEELLRTRIGCRAAPRP